MVWVKGMELPWEDHTTVVAAQVSSSAPPPPSPLVGQFLFPWVHIVAKRRQEKLPFGKAHDVR